MTMKDILNLTMIQFNNILEGIMRKQNWELSVVTAPHTGKLEEKDFLFYSKPSEDDVTKMSDIEGLLELAKG